MSIYTTSPFIRHSLQFKFCPSKDTKGIMASNNTTYLVKQAYTKAQSDIKGRLDGHYQHEGVKWMLTRELDGCEVGRGGILADDMGLGKTMQMIATMRGNPMQTLIVTIVGTVGQWRDALIEFGGMRPIIVNSSFTGILPICSDKSGMDVILTTYSFFQKAKVSDCLLKVGRWGRIVLDEGHKIRNPLSKGNKEISKLRADVKWILSGTPIQNSKKDILSLAKWIGGYDSVCVDVDWIVENMVLRRTQEEQAKVNPRLALPGLETVMMCLDFETDDEKKFYERVEEYYTSRASEGTDTLEALIRCRQAATHPMLLLDAIVKKLSTKKRRRTFIVQEDDTDDICELPKDMPSSTSKFNYLIGDIVNNVIVGKEKCLVFCTWTNEMKLLQHELNAKGVSSLIYDGSVSRDNKEAIIYNFKNTEIGVLILQITCGNAGLNLQCATRVYITTPHWNPCVELQAIGRAYRKGQVMKVKCVRLAMKGTVEDRCSDVQVEKLDMICDTMNDETMIARLGKEVHDRASKSVYDFKSESDCDDMPIV